jgi:serine/threonine-protein kinase
VLELVAGFRVEELIGRGAMAEVYRATDETTGDVVALKLLDGSDDRFRQRFLRESEIASRLDHPNVVRTLDSGEDDGKLYLAMELIEGADLRRILREEGRLEPELAVSFVEQVASALDSAHREGLVHRDVKPGNILVSGDHAYVCDFGLARHVASVSSLTGDRGFVGTIDYVPPEQIEGTPVDSRADVYSLGCVLYECLTGLRPFERDSELSVVFAHLNEQPPRVTDARPELPAAFDEVIATALAKSPDDRFQSCGELAGAARAALQGKVVAPRRPRRRFGLTVLAAAVVAIAAVAGALLFSGGGHAKLPTTITPDSIAGAKLGDSNILLNKIWGGGQKLVMTAPPDYSELTQRTRNLAAYFAGTTDRAVQIDTWNSRDRTAEGIGPCSTVADLKKAYGKRLKPNPHSTRNGVTTAWLLGKHLTFATGPVEAPKFVTAVGLYGNDITASGFNVQNEAPCAAAVDTSAVKRPATVPVVKTPRLTSAYSSASFTPRVTARTPSGWRKKSDSPAGFVLAGPRGATLRFSLDPAATSGAVSWTPRGIVTWLQHRPALVVAAPEPLLLGKPILTATAVELHSPTGSTYLDVRGGSLRVAPGERQRLYLALVRIGSLTHTMAIAVAAPSAAAFQAAAPAANAIVKAVRVNAAAAASLTALSTFCTKVFYGTCLGEVEAGTHSTSSMHPKVTYAVPVGWTNFTDHGGNFGLYPPGGDFNSLDAGFSDRVDAFTSIATAREGCAEGNGAFHTPEAFVRWLHGEPGIAPFTERRATVGGLSGFVVDLRIRPGFKHKCPWSQGVVFQQILTGRPPSPTDLAFGLFPPAEMHLYLLSYKGGTLGIVVQDVRGDARIDAYDKVVHTFRFG